MNLFGISNTSQPALVSLSRWAKNGSRPANSNFAKSKIDKKSPIGAAVVRDWDELMRCTAF